MVWILVHRGQRLRSRRGSTGRADLGQSKIQYLCVALFGNKDICWLDVPVDYALRVGRIESLSYIYCDLQRPLQFHRTTRNQMLEGLALQILHRNEAPALVFANFVNGANIRMI